MSQPTQTPVQTVGFFKRLIVVVYDGLLLFAVAFFISALLMGLFQWLAPAGFFIDPAQPDNPKIRELTNLGRMVGNVIVSINCLLVSFFFYGWFWTHGGQTLGMKAWNLYLVKPDGKFIDWKISAKRYFAAIISWAIFGLGFTWILVNKRKRAWHDILSNTQIIQLKNKKN